MKLLYIGHYKENSGWSKAATNMIEAILTTDINLVCRDIKLTETVPVVSNKILELENKDLNNVDYCIQNVLPHHITGTNKFKKNIAFFINDLDSIKYHHWYHNLQLVDEVWVSNQDSKNNLISDGFCADKVRVIPIPSDINSYKDSKQRIVLQDNNHKFKFYFICEIDDRKNLESILRCFHSEFHASEPVLLVLKIKRTGSDPLALRNGISKLCNEIKSQMRIYKSVEEYNHEIIITDDFTDEQIRILHLSCDCYVGPTHGEGWGIPSFDAMCYGKTPICSDEGGPRTYIDRDNKNTGWLVGGTYGVCNHRNPAFNDIFTGANHWFIPNEIEIKKAMRYYYENRNNKNPNDGISQGAKFSYERVGNMIKDALND